MKGKLLAIGLLLMGFHWLPADEPKGDAAKTKAVAKEMDSFAGTWEIAAIKPDGAAKEAKRLAFRKDGTYAALDKDGKELWSGTFEIDPTAKPKVWDHRSHEGKAKGDDVLGIYELNGDSLKVCCVVGKWKENEWTGKPRPKEIKLEGADVMIELRRAK